MTPNPRSSAGLWRHADFMKLWTGQAVSQFGSMVTRDALPLIGVLVLRATPVQMGFLAAAGSAPVIILGLLAGAWVDRLRRRPILIAADLGRALLVGSIPVAALLGQLSLTYLAAVAAATGALTVIFDVAYGAYLPSLVAREHLLEGNCKLGVTASLAEIIVPGLTGLMVQLISAPLTLLVDAFSFLASALSLGLIRQPEPLRRPGPGGGSVRHEIRQGLRMTLGHPVLRTLALLNAWSAFFGAFYGALYSLYALQVLGVQPVMLGIFIAGGGVGALVGAAVAGRFTRRLGLGPALVVALVVTVPLAPLTPLAGGPLWLIFLCMFVPQLIGDLFDTIFEITTLSLRQAITPGEWLGRVTASTNVLSGGAFTVGLLVGGALGSLVGARNALWVAVIGSVIGKLLFIFSPPAALRETPTQIAEPSS
jgi:MFS family permease